MGKHLTPFELGKIVAYKECGLSIAEIARRMSRCKATISYALQRIESRGTHERKVGSGRPKKTTNREDRRIVRTARRLRFSSANAIRRAAAPQISTTTLIRRLRAKGIRSRIAAKKVLIKKDQMKKRVKWAKEHKDWSPEMWSKVLFSDESTFCTDWRGHQRVWREKNDRYAPENIMEVPHNSKKVSVWGCFCANGVGELYRIEGELTSAQYENEVIKKCMPESADTLFMNTDWIFQQDNAPVHKSTSTTRYLSRHFNVIEWPAMSPDLNPIENIWAYLKRNVAQKNPKDENELFQAIKEEWALLSIRYLQDLVQSMPNRCKQVIKQKGWPTKY
ncbi:hypothetical protein RFI_40123 [Reticulomyxa filosa]|uniref:Tc1-like transposase DDE domain-containing protein n=1 Tax=Reticulomyxa filosa TaxID=46433 RepID=X6L8N0_RETFI|nr:hypothetical protein RFI_40123 [Reticulomyxa filosa]|eukprot:ETN97406.1 hypothetical protein RFI_40123 [Reticulomyxa filosa]